MLPIYEASTVNAMTRDAHVSSDLLQPAGDIVNAVRTGGMPALEELARRFDHKPPERPLVVDRSACQAALHRIGSSERELLERVTARIEIFAQAQLRSIQSVECAIPGGTAGQTIQPLRTAGCYVPGGRYPLVSSLLMTAVTARVAGVRDVWIACPAPVDAILAAAEIAGAQGVLAAGGAQAIAALAYGVTVPRCDVIVGPGNRWVTAAKFLVSATTRIDMLAGPTELLIVADATADPGMVAADLLAQAEHDADARPMLIAPSAEFVARVRQQISEQLANLPTRDVAEAGLRNSFAVIAADDAAILALCESIAPEHLELHVERAQQLADRVTRCGCVFIGSQSGEVLGDYGAGPNHVLPTCGTARFASGLSVENFLRRQTWLRIEHAPAAQPMLEDAVNLAICEGLAGHAESARRRLISPPRRSGI